MRNREYFTKKQDELRNELKTEIERLIFSCDAKEYNNYDPANQIGFESESDEFEKEEQVVIHYIEIDHDFRTITIHADGVEYMSRSLNNIMSVGDLMLLHLIAIEIHEESNLVTA